MKKEAKVKRASLSLTLEQIENILWSIDVSNYMYLDLPLPEYRKEIIERLKILQSKLTK